MLVETELELYLEIVLVLNAKTLLQSPLLANTPLRRLWDLLHSSGSLKIYVTLFRSLVSGS